LSDFASTPIDRMSLVGDTRQPQTAKVSSKRELPKRKFREPDQEEPPDPEEAGRHLDIEA
jgi:hypothetical protein